MLKQVIVTFRSAPVCIRISLHRPRVHTKLLIVGMHLR